jgi:hypothetical protein
MSLDRLDRCAFKVLSNYNPFMPLSFAYSYHGGFRGVRMLSGVLLARLACKVVT